MSKQSIQTKVQNDHPEFVDEVAGLSIEQLDSRLAQLAKDNQAVNESKETDLELTEALKHSSSLGAPYREAKAAIKNKSVYLISLIKEKGGK